MRSTDIIAVPWLCPTGKLREIIHATEAPFLLLTDESRRIEWKKYGLDRMSRVARDTGVEWVYADRYEKTGDGLVPHPTTPYLPGSLRDDFDFGPAVLVRRESAREALEETPGDYRFAALYDLRLRLSRAGAVLRIPEYLYTAETTDLRLSGEKQFDYVDPRNREVQLEMEAACTDHLKAIDGWLPPVRAGVEFERGTSGEGSFPVEMSVVIPVRNRAKTIGDAVRSALSQKTDRPFNVVVVDNHSTDGTTERLRQLAASDGRLVHHIPQPVGLGIGGCWNEAVTHPACGRFAVQLDSDDLYIDTDVLEKIADTFRRERCAMVIGSYSMVNFELESLPPGLIDHREWTEMNGHNNALRINGLGAPRAFYVPVLRENLFPDTSYGEDYAVALAMCRRYRIARIYQSLYLCRRWAGNSDAALSIEKVNANNYYKDTVRTIELAVRQKINGKKG